MSDQASLGAAKAHLARLLRPNHEVNGVGIGRVGAQWVLRVNLRSDGAAVRHAIPSEIDGVPVAVHVVGPVTASRELVDGALRHDGGVVRRS